MNSQERDQLSQFLKQLGEVKLAEKDTEAEALIRDASARQPDAAYLLVQRALLLEQALNSAKARIDELQNQLQNASPASRGGFLNSDPWAQPAGGNGGQVPGIGNYQVPRYAPPQQAQPGAFGGGSSFLGNIATTAAGVVAGSFLFQGIESLMGHHGGAGAGWGEHAAADHTATDHASEQTVINNYYGDDAVAMANHEGNDDTHLVNADFESFSDDSFADNSSESDWI